MSDLTTQDLNIVRTQNHAYTFNVTGLKPNTKHKLYVEGENFTWATRQFGKDFGDDIVSDDSGRVRVQLLAQWNYPRDQNFELPEQQTLSFQTGQLGQGTGTPATRTVKNYRIVEVKSDDNLSYAQFQMKLNMVLTPGPVQTLYPIEV